MIALGGILASTALRLRRTPARGPPRDPPIPPDHGAPLAFGTNI